VPGTQDHVVLEGECIDRMYLNVYVPQLQRVGGVVVPARPSRSAPCVGLVVQNSA
jgi:hypothetical protein